MILASTLIRSICEISFFVDCDFLRHYKHRRRLRNEKEVLRIGEFLPVMAKNKIGGLHP